MTSNSPAKSSSILDQQH